MKKFLLVFLALATAAYGQGSLGDYSKDLKLKSLQSPTITIGTGAAQIVITGGTIAFGTGAVTTTGTLQSITVAGLQLSGGSATLTGILDGGTARNTVIQTGTTSGNLVLGGGSMSMVSTGTIGMGSASSASVVKLFGTGATGSRATTAFQVSGGIAAGGLSIIPRILFVDGYGNTDITVNGSNDLVLRGNGGSITLNSGGLVIAGSASIATGFTLGSASGLVIAPNALATAASVTWDFSKASHIVTGSSEMTIALGTAGLTTAGQESKFVIIGGSAGSTIAWSGALGEPQLYIGTSIPITSLGSGQRLEVSGTSQGTGTPGLILRRGP